MVSSYVPALVEVPAERIGGRFRIEQLLSRGGMGVVYRVLDESSGREVALKRLSSDVRDAATTRMFEREFQTLAEIRHPRIIEVYEYGVDSSGPYYTMELLEGRELRELAPLPYRVACRYVRDVASSLGLLHARQLVHRDVSPRNVKLTRDGLAKLIDFGALASFGVTEQVVGTPPCIAPEGVLGVPLDHRADLYSLGAVLYVALTGQHAYPVAGVDELIAAWRVRPAKPSSLVAGIPVLLDELVLSLLSYDAMARPSSASEVIQRLEAVAGLDSGDDDEQSQSFLSSSPLVGRDREVAGVRALVQRAVAGSGGAIVLSGAAGIGKSRLLSMSMMEGRLAGMAAVRAGAREHARPYGVMGALCVAALHVVPELAERSFTPHLPVLVHAVPELRDRFRGTAAASLPDDAVERRVRVTEALVESFVDLAASYPLLVVVDDLPRADLASLEVIGGLARGAATRQLLIMATQRTGEEAAAPAALTRLLKIAGTIELPGLAAAETEALVRALFGDAPHTERLAAWMQGMTGGNPAQCVDVALHLVRKGIVRYAKGVWIIPSDTTSSDLPSTVDQARRDRIASLDDAARRLAEQLSVHRGPLHVDLCNVVAGMSGSAADRQFDELVARGVLARVGPRYAFVDETLRETLWRDLAADRRRDLHLRLAAALVATGSGPQISLDAGWHLLRGGEIERGATLLEDAANEMAWSGEGLQDAAAPLEAALAAYAARGRPPDRCPEIVIPLVVGGQSFDRRLVARHGRSAFAAVRRVTGLETASRLRPYTGERLALYAGLASAALWFGARPKRERRQGFRAMIVGSLSAAVALVAAATSRFDADEVQALVRGIAPLQALPKGHVGHFIYDFCDSLLDLAHGRDTGGRAKLALLLDAVERPGSLAGLADPARVQFKAGLLLLLGVGDGYLGGGLARAREIEAMGLRAYRSAAEQLRGLHHAHRGRMDLAERHALRYEAQAAGTVTSQLEVTMPQTFGTIHWLTGDVVALRRTIEQLDDLAEELPAAALYRDLSKAGWHASLGDVDTAIGLFEQLLEGRSLEFPGWLPALGLYAGALNAGGHHARARDVCARVFDRVSADELCGYTFHLLPRRERALADAGLGQLGQAIAQLETMVEETERDRNPLSCGLLRSDLAELALKAEDRGAFEHHFERMNAWFRSTRNPALIAKCERLASRTSNPPRAGPVTPAQAAPETLATTVRRRPRNAGRP